MRYQSLKWDIKDKRFLAVVDNDLLTAEVDVSQRADNGARALRFVRRLLAVVFGVVFVIALVGIVGFGILR
ncbi:MAG: hypothetical protein LBK67_07440 [Coriobacteriales bacterium]|jgi:hypothetical protein|nr:hypothetical protein [Coriobacteriales bacterium]